MGWFRRNEHDEEQLSAYLDGELDARHAETVERHLSTCDSCAALLEELRETRALLSALPTQAPPRSFVLGAEYARAPVREVARPSRRFNLALAPAVALSVFVALLVVDLGHFSSTSSDESSTALTAATAREMVTGDAAASGAAGSIASAPVAPETANSAADGAGTTAGKGADDSQSATAAEATPAAPGVGMGGAVEPEEGLPPVAMSAAEEPTPGEGGPEIAAAAHAPEESPIAPQAFEAPEGDSESGGGVSTLRLLEILAGAAVLASGFYVYLWPRLSREGS